MTERDWKAYGIGIGLRPFWWRLGLMDFGGQTFLHLGPLFISWKLPFRVREATGQQGGETP